MNRIIENAKDTDLFQSFENIVDNPKKVWCKINSKFLHKKHCGNALPSELEVGNGSKTTDKKNIVNSQKIHTLSTKATSLPLDYQNHKYLFCIQ